MNKLFNETSFLSEDGLMFCAEFKKALTGLIEYKAKDLTAQELRILGSCLRKMVGDAVSDELNLREQTKTSFDNMTDDEFITYLKDKYGDKHMFVSLTPEELARVPASTKEDFEAALEEGRKNAAAFLEAQGHHIPPRGFYK